MDDQPGALADHCEAIAGAGVNILAVVAMGGGDATAAILTDNPDATAAVLDGMGANYEMADLRSVKLPHRPGALAEFTRDLANSDVNLSSLYVMSISDDSATVGYTTS